jgi:hypothetical protein
MTNEEAINVLNDYDINFERHTAEEIAEAHEIAIKALEQESCEDCCNGNQEEKAKLCQKSYIAGMEHNCENEEIIKLSKDGQPSEDWNAVLDELNRIGRNAFKDDTDYDNLFDFISNLPNVKPQSKTDILDKIRAEIEQAFIDDAAMQEYTVEECLRIIDKYKAESEDET